MAICILVVAYSFFRPIVVFYTNKQAEYGSFILARGLWFMDVRLVDAIFIHYMLSILILEDIANTNCYSL